MRQDGTFIRRYEAIGEVRDIDGRRLSLHQGTSVLIPNERTVTAIEVRITRVERHADTPAVDGSLGREELIRTQGRDILSFTRPSILGEQRLLEFRQQGRIDDSMFRRLESIMGNGNDRFFPVVL